MTDEQIKLLRLAIQREVECASIDGFEHGAWGWAEKVADEKWKEFQESFKPVEINGIKKQSKTLTDILYRWWDDVFTAHSDWDMETSIEDLVDQVEQWLPKPQSSADYQSLTAANMVEGWNNCLKKIKSKLR